MRPRRATGPNGHVARERHARPFNSAPRRVAHRIASLFSDTTSGRTEYPCALPPSRVGFKLGAPTRSRRDNRSYAPQAVPRIVQVNVNVTKFRWPVRVYYEDTDAGGVVYHANYLKFFERARTEWLRALGFEQDQLRDEHGLVFVVHDMALRFHQPARFNDQLVVTCDVERARGASMMFHQEILAADQEKRLCDADLTVACIDSREFRPRPIPKPIRAEMQHAR